MAGDPDRAAGHRADAAAAARAWWRRGRAGARCRRCMAVAALGATVSAVVQHKGWSYHALPVRLLAGLLAVVLAARWLDRALPAAAGDPRRAGRWPWSPPSASASMASPAPRRPGGEITWSWSRGGEMTALLKREAYGERLLVLSPDIFPVFPALNYARAQSTLRTMNLWLLQGVYHDCPAGGARYRETWEMSRAEFFVYRTVAEDFSPRAAGRHPGLDAAGHPGLRQGIRRAGVFRPPPAIRRDAAALPPGGRDRGLPAAAPRGLMHQRQSPGDADARQARSRRHPCRGADGGGSGPRPHHRGAGLCGDRPGGCHGEMGAARDRPGRRA